MARQALAIRHSNRPVTDRLHPAVYKLAVGLVLLYVAAAWGGFYNAGDPELLLGMVSVLLFVAVVIPLILWGVWRRHHVADDDGRPDANTSFRAWAFGDFDTWQSRLKGRDAMIDILLPLAAVAFGLMSIGIVFRIIALLS